MAAALTYVDTSVMVALIVPEPHSAAVTRWYGRSRGELVSAICCLAEFASALGIKQRTGQIDVSQARAAWGRFEQLIAGDLALLPPVAANFHRAAAMATLDTALGRHARRFKIKAIVFS